MRESNLKMEITLLLMHSSNSIKNFIDSILDNELLVKKEKYDKAYIMYWSAGNNPPRFKTISLKEFKKD